jgi:hypothetical protein
MLEHAPHLSSIRGFLGAVCLAVLAGCGGSASSGSSGQPPVGTSDPGSTSSDSGTGSAPASGSSTSGTGSSTSGSGSSTSGSGSSAPTGGSSAPPAGSSAPPAGAPPNATVPPLAAVPAHLTATSGNALVTLNWTASSGATSYNVKRSTTNGGPFTQLATATSVSYNDATVTNNVTYYYVVSAVNAAGQSANSTEASVIPDPTITIPPIPTGIAAAPADAKVTLTWTASNGATTYSVKRATTTGGPYQQVATPASPSYTDSAVTDGTTYYYVVSAVDSAGASANSVQVSALPAAPVSNPAPTTFGTWINVTPTAIDLTDALSCGNYGSESVQVDPAHPSNLYTEFNCQGIWKSTDYGATWTGPINTGANGAAVSDCAGGITIAPSSTATVPTIYESCIRGSGTGFWKSVDGGVNWTLYFVAPSGASRQDYYPPVVDPYDPNHLLMAGHEMDYLVESVDGGQTWTNDSMNSGMMENGGTGAIFFINTGNASTTRETWLWMGQQSGGIYGTWRTANNGGTWVQVDKNEHPHGIAQIYQPDSSGVVYMSGAYSTLGWGVLRSSDYGQTWVHVGLTSNENVVFGTSKNVYSMFGYPVGPGGTNNPAFEIAAQPGTGTWVAPGTPSGLTQGSAQITVVNDGTHNIFVGAMWNNGVWRYIEP